LRWSTSACCARSIRPRAPGGHRGEVVGLDQLSDLVRDLAGGRSRPREAGGAELTGVGDRPLRELGLEALDLLPVLVCALANLVALGLRFGHRRLQLALALRGARLALLSRC
jgi:hypothetical protein